MRAAETRRKTTTQARKDSASGRGGFCDCYNRSRRRLRARQSAGQQPRGAAVAALVGMEWEGPSGPYLQQVMPGWRAGLSWQELICCLATLAVSSGCLTVASFVCWASTVEVELDYTGCANATPALCHLSLLVTSNLTAPVYVYYAMHNAYFNHRKIQMSWSMPQMLGLPANNLAKQCGVFTNRDGRQVLPCGALPNAIFNDTFAIFGPEAGKTNWTNASIPLSSEGIGWPSDIRGLYTALPPERLSGTVRPVSWPAPAEQRYRRPFEDSEDLHSWLRTPALSSFRKMQHRLLPDSGLSSGTYRLVVGYNYPVTAFGGVKRFIVAEKSAFGGKNVALALLSLAVCASYSLLCVSTLVEGYCRQRKWLTR